MGEGLRAFATIFAGIGILFVGLTIFKKFTDLLLVNRRFRLLVTKWVSKVPTAAATGVALGAITLSTNTVRAIFSNLLSVRSIALRQALIPVSWTMLGTCVIYFLFALDLQTASVVCLAIGSLNFVVSRHVRYEHWIGLIFALGLILFGMQFFQEGIIRSGQSVVSWNVWVNNSLETIHEADPGLHEVDMILPASDEDELLVSPMSELHDSLHYWDEFYHNVIFFLQNSTFFLFFVGLSAALLFTQIGGGFLAISLGGLGYIGFDQATWMIFGVMIGAGLTEAAKAWMLKGESQKLTSYISVLYLLAGALGIFLWLVEQFLGVPLVRTMATSLSTYLPMQIAWVPFLVSLNVAVLATLFAPLTPKILNKFFPQDANDDIMKPKFINDQALSEPEFAVDLIALEEQDICKRLPPYIDLLRKEAGTLETGVKIVAKERLHDSYTHVCTTLKEFVQDLMHESISSQTAEYLLDRLEVLSILEAFEEHLWALINLFEDFMKGQVTDNPRKLVGNICEVLDIFLMTTMDAIDDPDSQNIEILTITSSGSGDQMKNLRKAYLASELALDDQGRNNLRWILFHFENYIIATQRIASLLDKHN
ncbi:hypothetical protein AB751O23_BE_00020 [Chlamydiales bacterium SCGC AB-751-O23]|jgi:phosphate:Na+ symporter|nr:hypothetical protein AB751O23_BE_00020 [Chlamydiales bacterium SCGC AB-751-O23]